MSSLWALFRKKPQIAYDRTIFPADTIPPLVSGLLKWPTILINATSLVLDLKSERCSRSTSWDLTPGFTSIWIEYINAYSDGSSGREAVSIFRLDRKLCKTHPSTPDNAKHYLCFYLWAEKDGIACLRGAAQMFIDSLGEPLDEDGCQWVHWHDDDGNQQFAIALETLTTMNTRGTRVEPPLDAKPVQVVKPTRAPCSVWHTIHLPKMLSVPMEGAETSDTILERREHWVRAHRRDYRQGAGMFGRVKALVWVPEFQRGNPELGTVKQSYAIGKQEMK
jgi:hypothetical protein